MTPLDLHFWSGQSILTTDRGSELMTGLDDNAADVMVVVVSLWMASWHLIIEPSKWFEFECSWLGGSDVLLRTGG